MSFEITNEQLNDYFRSVLADAEALVKATANMSGENLGEVRAKVEQSLKAVKTGLAEARETVRYNATAAARAGDSYVHDNPWEAIGLAAGAGLLVGVLIARR